MTSLQSSLLRGGGAGGRVTPTTSSSSRDKAKQGGSSNHAHLPEAYQQERPPWRPPLHPSSTGATIPDLFPTKPNQPEDDLSQISVRKGFTPRTNVRNEAFSAHEMIFTRLSAPETLTSLSTWMDEVVKRRHLLDKDKVAPSQYKPPSRVTLNEAKLANYVKDLADPSVPLTRLSKSVPHGFRGEKLFEMLWAGGALPNSTGGNNTYFAPRNAPSTPATPAAANSASRKSVDISRAVWFIRALGAAELSSLRNKSAATIVPEITANLCTWMAKQVAELTLIHAPESSGTAAASPAPASSPSTYTPRTPGGPPQSLSRSVAAAHFARTPSNLIPASPHSPAPAKEVCSVLQNDADEERWTAKWSYSLSLARHLHAQHLLDRSVLVKWIVDAFAASNLVQLPFLVELVQEVLVFVLKRRCFVRPFLTALVVQIPALDARLDRNGGGGLRTKLVLLFRIVCGNCPDALMSPRLWSEHAPALNQLLQELNDESESEFAEYVERTVKPRVDRLLLHTLDRDTSSPMSPALQQHADIQALDSFDMKTIDRVFLQTLHGKAKQRDDAFWTPRVETILTWACAHRRTGVERQYLAATLIEKIRFGVSWEETNEGSDQISLPAFDLEHNGKRTRKINVEPMLIKWLGKVEVALVSSEGLLASVEVGSIVVLTGELARRGVFSYTKYLQRLIARGMTTVSSSGKKEEPAAASRDSLHLRLLRSLPLYDQPASVYQQRRQAIYGDRAKETYEDAAQRRALRQLQAFLPFAFSDQTEPAPPLTNDLEEALSRLWSASRFVRLKIFRNDLLPAVSSRIDSFTGEQLAQVAAVLVMGEDFEGLAQLLATLLLRPLSDSLARASFNMVIEYSLVWRSMDIMSTLNQLVRQQLNHSSSVRNDRQAVMASTTLLRLRTLIEGVPSRTDSVEIGGERDGIQGHVQVVRGNVDALLDRLSQQIKLEGEAVESAHLLTPFRSLFLAPDATSDEIIERTIVESVLDRSQPALIPAAVRLIDQLYLEASLEIDERHARWLAHLATCLEHNAYSDSSIKALLGLLSRLVAHGTLNLQLCMETLLLPYISGAVRKITDPATQGNEVGSHLGAIVSCLSEIFGTEGKSGGSWEDRRAFGAQTTLLFAPPNLPTLLRIATLLVCASEEASLPTSDKEAISSFYSTLLSSQPALVAFRSNPRLCLSTIRDTAKSIWGCNPVHVLNAALTHLDPSSLLLQDVTYIDSDMVRSRLDGWDTAVTASQLGEIFDRLGLVESSAKARAEQRIKALAGGLWETLFVQNPSLGEGLLRYTSGGLGVRFTDVGLRVLAEKVKGEDKGVEEVLRSVLRMCEGQHLQGGFLFNATDSESCLQILVHCITSLEAGVNASGENVGTQLSNLTSSSNLTLDLLHLVLRFGCLYTHPSLKTLSIRLVRSLLTLTRLAGEKVECGPQFSLLLDSLCFVLDELPPALLTGCIPELEKMLSTVELATPERQARMQHLSTTLDGAGGERGWFTATSARAAVGKGEFVAGGVGVGPWDRAEYLGDGGGGGKEEEAGRGARTGWPHKLALNSSIPTSMLGVRVTRDLLPNYSTSPDSSTPTAEEGVSGELPLFVESERSYGDRSAGEPMFSRDLRRGLLVQPIIRRDSEKEKVGDKDKVKVGEGVREGRGTAVGLGNEAMEVIDLTWDDDEPMSLPQQIGGQAGGGGGGGGGGGEKGSGNVGSIGRKRRMSKRD